MLHRTKNGIFGFTKGVRIWTWLNLKTVYWVGLQGTLWSTLKCFFFDKLFSVDKHAAQNTLLASFSLPKKSIQSFWAKNDCSGILLSEVYLNDARLYVENRFRRPQKTFWIDILITPRAESFNNSQNLW